MTRTTRDLCQDCWQDLHPTEYAPTMSRFGDCDRCSDPAYVGRSIIADETPRCWCNALSGQEHEMGSNGCAYDETTREVRA